MALGLSVLLAMVSLRAQPPAPAQPEAQPPPPRREGTAEFSFVGTGGNASTSALGVGGEYVERPGPWVLRAKTAYVRNESADELKAETFAVLGRASRTLTPRLSAFGEYGYLQDRFAGIESRNTVDSGVTFALVRPQPHQLDLDASIGYAHENRVVGENISTPHLSPGARYKLTLSDTADITEELYFGFSLSDADDWRTRNTVALTAKVTTLFSLKVSNNVRYVNAPVEGFETTDVITSVALVAKF